MNGSVVPRKYNTTGTAKTLVGNWYEDALWASQDAQFTTSAKLDHTEMFSSGREFDMDKPQEVAGSVVHAGIGKRKQAVQEALWRQALESELPDTREERPTYDAKLPAVGKTPGKKTFKQRSEHTDLFTDEDKRRYETSNVMGKFSETARENSRTLPRAISPSRANLTSPYSTTGGTSYLNDVPVTVYTDTLRSGGTIPGTSKAAGSNPFAKTSHFSQTIGEYKGGATTLE
eukprot:TRINITY_DN5174_c0_g1_i2.p1 TRINITY_DN5174_c0_g1~~TRINITY_DN5174_c0_g1_i2.p1  ORF type:complete len:231 (+),score=15.31 TRINITY_DN5174_c0_g1_i2:65-757(+)